MTYELEKQIWTEADFEQMGWHDSLIYQMRLGQDLELDIDYIFQWNQPDLEGLFFTCWVAPATLVFPSPNHLVFELDLQSHSDRNFEISEIQREPVDEGSRWTILTHNGYIEFINWGYTQYIRQPPFFKFGQTIDYDERNGTSLERTTNQANPNRHREDIAARRHRELEDYEYVKKRHLARLEKDALEQQRAEGRIDLKTYLIQKRAIDQRLTAYEDWLRGTGFR